MHSQFTMPRNSGWTSNSDDWLGRNSASWQESDGLRATVCERGRRTFYQRPDGSEDGGVRKVASYEAVSHLFLEYWDRLDKPSHELLDSLGGPDELFGAKDWDPAEWEDEEELVPLEDRSEEEQIAAGVNAAALLATMPCERPTTADDFFNWDARTSDNTAHTFEEAVAALETLRRLAPRLAVVHHQVVGRQLSSPDADLASLAAHTLACLGPEAVADHFEELVSMMCDASPEGEAVLLALSVLEPEHLLRLEARGAPSVLVLEATPLGQCFPEAAATPLRPPPPLLRRTIAPPPTRPPAPLLS